MILRNAPHNNKDREKLKSMRSISNNQRRLYNSNTLLKITEAIGGSTLLISFPLITSHQSQCWFEWFGWWEVPKALKHQSGQDSTRHPPKWCHITSDIPKTKRLIPLYGHWSSLGLNTLLGPSVEGRGQEQDVCLAQFFCYSNRCFPTMGEISLVRSCVEHSMSLH